MNVLIQVTEFDHLGEEKIKYRNQIFINDGIRFPIEEIRTVFRLLYPNSNLKLIFPNE